MREVSNVQFPKKFLQEVLRSMFSASWNLWVYICSDTFSEVSQHKLTQQINVENVSIIVAKLVLTVPHYVIRHRTNMEHRLPLIVSSYNKDKV